MNRWLGQLRPWLSRNRSWLGRASLVIGAALVAAQLLPALTANHQVIRFDFGQQSHPVTQVAFTWTQEGDDPLHGGATLTPLADDSEPLSHAFRVPDGLYRFDLQVERTDAQGHRTQTNYVRRVALDGNPTTLLLHPHH